MRNARLMTSTKIRGTSQTVNEANVRVIPIAYFLYVCYKLFFNTNTRKYDMRQNIEIYSSLKQTRSTRIMMRTLV